MKKLLSILAAGALLFGGGSLSGLAKKALGHEDFDGWKRARNYGLSRDGRWEAFAAVPQEGDAMLTLYNTATGKRIEIPRGYNPKFTADSRYAVALVKPFFADTRKGKIDKKKDFDLPQDSLAIVDLKTGHVEKIGHVKGFALGKDGGSWLAYKSCDTLHVKAKDLKDKKAGMPLVVRNLAGPGLKIVKRVDNYVFSNDGSKLALTTVKPEKDSLATAGLGVVSLPDTTFRLISRDLPFYGIPVFNETGTRLAFTASADSTETGTRKARLYMSELTSGIGDPQDLTGDYHSGYAPNLALPHSSDPAMQAELEKKRAELMKAARGEEFFINQYSIPVFSHDGRRLVVGVAPYVCPDDTTIVDFERADLDIWRWDAPYNPPQEKKLVDKLRKHTFPVVIDLKDLHQNLLTSNPLVTVTAPDRWDGDWALEADPTGMMVERQWNYYAPTRLSSVNVLSGERRTIATVPYQNYDISPAGNYVVWFDNRAWWAYSNKSGETVEVSKGADTLFWDDQDDHPCPADPFGVAAWSEGDADMLVYDRYDIWSLDPSGKRAPVCLTKGEGARKRQQFRYENLDPERRFLKKGDLMVLSVLDKNDKRTGIATMTYGAPQAPNVRMLDKASFTQLRKARNADVFSWQRASFEIAPDIWLGKGLNFSAAKKLSDTNPQQKDYSWGTAQLVKWRTYEGREAEGVLYLPEDFDSSKEYPMMTVFYELAADDLYRHYTMEPSWSWVNYPFYVSRGYVVFVPDIRYTAGVPGECAYNYVCSGVEEMCRLFPNIDRKRLGIDGQSWGGYQTAYLVTRTDMFACAGSGAPVANMTSAFGGIRWGSGDSRQGQYEQGQSRIGRNLWEAPELYIANSPVFHADRVHTPLLIMHNDNDGAVPWYQGIEMFMALRRLQKPVWMLTYNGEEHNLIERKNRKDITVRLQQFFDHYLKGDKMPRWMKEGIPATRKGQEMRYEIVD